MVSYILLPMQGNANNGAKELQNLKKIQNTDFVLNEVALLQRKLKYTSFLSSWPVCHKMKLSYIGF